MKFSEGVDSAIFFTSEHTQGPFQRFIRDVHVPIQPKFLTCPLPGFTLRHNRKHPYGSPGTRAGRMYLSAGLFRAAQVFRMANPVSGKVPICL